MAIARTTIAIASDLHLKLKLACVKREKNLFEAAEQAFGDLLEKWDHEDRAMAKRGPGKRQESAVAA